MLDLRSELVKSLFDEIFFSEREPQKILTRRESISDFTKLSFYSGYNSFNYADIDRILFLGGDVN